MQISSLFEDKYGYRPAASLFTSGRVNLIGEHTDYNGGMVLPTALELGVSVSFKPRTDQIVRIYSEKFEVMAECSLQDSASNEWYDYALGGIIYGNKAGFLQGGADLAIGTNLPFGAGLSSSAALTVGILKLARDHAAADMSDTQISQLARRIENEFIGMPCGIMDQMAVAIARAGQALALNTQTLQFDLVDLPQGYHMAVIHSGQYRRLAEGHYKIRKEECDAVKDKLGHDNICLMSDTEFSQVSKVLEAPLLRRARHCMTEHRRTIKAVEAIRQNNIQLLGELMNESHVSMKDDFEMSLPEIDQLVDSAVEFGALGARLTGGGFGGCIVACVPKDQLEQWTKKLLTKHPVASFVA